MKVKEILPLLSHNQETQLHYKNFGYCASFPKGFMGIG